MTRFRVIIFDVNGTLLGYDDPRGFEKRFAAACRDLGHAVTVDRVVTTFSRVVQEWAKLKDAGTRRASTEKGYRRTMTWVYRLMLEDLQVPSDSQEMADALYERFIVREGFMPVFSDVIDTLKHLRRRQLRLGILSNFPPHLEETLKMHGIHGYFDFFVVSSLVGLEKPDPAIFELAVNKAHTPKEAICYVGDDLDDDIRGAEAVGLSAIWLDRLNRQAEADCFRIQGLSELEGALGTLSSRVSAKNAEKKG